MLVPGQCSKHLCENMRTRTIPLVKIYFATHLGQFFEGVSASHGDQSYVIHGVKLCSTGRTLVCIMCMVLQVSGIKRVHVDYVLLCVRECAWVSVLLYLGIATGRLGEFHEHQNPNKLIIFLA